MPAPRLHARLFATTRGRIIALLRRGASSVDELASALELTDNAVRLHLATLERDGLVRQAGVRRVAGAVGKPAHLYELSPDGAHALSSAYAPVLGALLDTLGERMEARELDAMLRDVGRRLGSPRVSRAPTLLARVADAARLLDELGGDVDVQESRDAIVLRGHGCPLAEATRNHHAACRAVERMVAEVVGSGARVRERCERGEQPSCRFEVVARTA